jgi:4'-phosphopantetheinyl transferase
MKTPLLGERLKRRRSLTRGLLAPLLSCPPDAVLWTLGPQGQPQLTRSTLAFNTSHCGSAWWMASAHTNSIGIDVELVREIPDAARLAERFFHPNEIARNWEDPRTFLTLWTAKEAVLKAEGCGIAADLDRLDASSVLTGDGPWILEAPSGTSWTLIRVPCPDPLVAIIALPEARPLQQQVWRGDGRAQGP